MRNSRDVKDKNITLEFLQYRAQVAYYNGRVEDCGLFSAIGDAQKVLDKYPRDVWDGYDHCDFKYLEVDDGRRHKPLRNNTRFTKAARRKQSPLHLIGRTFGRAGGGLG